VLTWSRVLLAVVVAGLIGAVAGWRLHPDPPPGVDLTAAYRAAASWRSASTERIVAGPVERVEGPVRIVERWRTASAPAPAPAPGCAPCPACDEHERIEERGPITTDTGPTTTSKTAEAKGASSSRTEERLVVTPPPPQPRPSWAVFGGAVVDGGGLGWQVGAAHRLLGPIWVEAAVQPAAVRASAGLRVEF
jgi:hypothetical protein